MATAAKTIPSPKGESLLAKILAYLKALNR